MLVCPIRPDLAEVAEHIDSFVTPVVAALVAGRPFSHHWRPAGPWEEAASDT